MAFGRDGKLTRQTNGHYGLLRKGRARFQPASRGNAYRTTSIDDGAINVASREEESKETPERWAWLRQLAENREHLIILVGGAAIALLSLLDVIESSKALVSTTLAVLSLMAFAALRDSKRRSSLAEIEISNRRALMHIREDLSSSRSIFEIAGSRDVSETFSRVLREPTIWHFQGGLGSFLRESTLPSIAKAVRGRVTTKSRVTIQVLDPSDAQVCKQYAEYRRRLAEQRNSQDAASWTLDKVQTGSAASILAALWFQQHENLQIEFGLLDRISSLRYDISDDLAMITNEDRSFPALAVTNKSPLYFAFLADLELSLRNSRRIDLGAARAELPRDWKEISTSSMRQCFNELVPELRFTDSDYRDVKALAFSPERKYTSA
jgi:hypothetical protein